MKYFTILILILGLSFFYVLLVDKDDNDIEIPRIKFLSNIDTSLIVEIPNNSFLKNIDVDLENYTLRNKLLVYDSLEYISETIEFKDSLIIDISKENQKNNIYVEFNMFLTQSNVFQKYRIHIGKGKSEFVVLKRLDSEIYNLRILKSIRKRWNRKKKKSIVLFDIAGLQDSLINDTTNFPFFSKMKEKSKSFTKTQLLSSNRYQSKLSLLKCIEPYLMLNDSFPFQKEDIFEKVEIISELRNSSMPYIYDASGYNTFYYGHKSDEYVEFSKLFNNSSFFSGGSSSDIKILQKFSNEINENKDAENFYYVDLNMEAIDNNLYLRSVDSYLKELFFHIKSKVDINDYIFVILSSSSENIYDPMLTMFYSEKSIDQKEISDKVNLMDISKTILSYSKLKMPYYFSGKNLVAKQGFEERTDILGSDLDTLMFYNDDILFKKQKYSDNYETIHLSDKNINTKKEDLGHIYNNFILQNYEGDHIKYLIFKNKSDQPITFNLKITSKNRFILLDNVKDYYLQKKKKRRYENKIIAEIQPFSKDTVKLFYRKRNQNFNFKFNEKIRLAYGALSISAGEVKDFYEESAFGVDHTITDKEEVFMDYDIKILNRRINY